MALLFIVVMMLGGEVRCVICAAVTCNLRRVDMDVCLWDVDCLPKD